MSFLRYPSYVDSGVSWSPTLPSGWKKLPTKRGFRRRKDLNSGMKCENRLSLTLNGVLPRSLDDLEGLQASEFETYQIFQKNDLVFKLIDLQNIKTSRVGIVHEEGIMSPAYIRLEPIIDKVFPKFAYWFFTDLYKREVFNKLGEGVRQTLGAEDLLALPFFYPSIEEQIKIANFLDQETKKIDDLLVEKEKLIDLLKEKQKAVLSSAVTKGIDQEVKTKPSGIQWIGDIPENWSLIPFRYCVEFSEGPGIMAVDFHESGVPLIRISGVGGRWVTLEGCNYIDPILAANKWSHFKLKLNDLLISASASMGTVSEVDEVTVGAIPYTGLIRLRPKNHSITRAFIRAFVVSSIFSKQIDELKTGATIQHFGPTHLSQIKMILPPTLEQDNITSYIDKTTSKYEALIGETQKALDLLYEHRSALISAAVTGQIDVRNLKNKVAA